MQATVKVHNLKADHFGSVVAVDLATGRRVPGVSCPPLREGESVTLDVPAGARLHLLEVEDRDIGAVRDYMRG